MFSDFFVRTGIIKQVAGASAKSLLVDFLRELFRDDSYFTYREDVYGYPKILDHTNLSIDSTEPTKINITDVFRYEAGFIPTIVVRHTGGRYFPISFNQDGIPGMAGSVKYSEEVVLDGYGNVTSVLIPDKFLYVGAWDLSYDLKIYTESPADREELVSIVSVGLMHVHRASLERAGLFIKSLSFGSESEEEHNNDKFYTQSVSLECFGEWRREIPVGNLIERIAFFYDIGRIVNNRVAVPNNLSIEDMVIELS